MFEYLDRGRWSNSIFYHVLMALLLWLPVAGLLLFVASDSGSIKLFLLSFSVSLILALLLFHRAQTNITFPTVEACDQHLVLNMPLTRRAVYARERIEGARFFWHILYFRHNGWPVLTPLPRMASDDRRRLLELLSEA